MVHLGIFFQFRFPLSSEILQNVYVHELLVLSYLLVFRKQLLIQLDAMKTKAVCHLRIIEQFLQPFFHSNEIKDNCLIKILPEIHKSQKLQTRCIPGKIKHNLGAVDYFSGNLRFSREYLCR